MSDQENTNGQKNVRPPTCPGCRTELLKFAERIIQLPSGLIAHMFYCPNDICRALFALQIVGQAAREPLIATPGMNVPPGFNPLKQ